MSRLSTTCFCKSSLDCATFASETPASASKESMPGTSAPTMAAVISVTAESATFDNSTRSSFSKTVGPRKNIVGKSRDASEGKGGQVHVLWESTP